MTESGHQHGPQCGRTPWLIALAVFLSLAGSLTAKEVPYLTGRVMDTAGLLSPAAEARIESALESLEEERGSQLAVLTVDALEGEAIGAYALRVAETWKLGRGEFDDGALFLISRDDRLMRIEVGYGLEPALTDILSNRILDEVVAPQFRIGDFDGGIEAGVAAMVGEVRGESTLPAPGRRNRSGSGGGSVQSRVMGFFFFVFIIGQFVRAALLSPGPGPWFLYVFLMPFFFIFPQTFFGAPAGLIVWGLWAVGFPILRLLTKNHRGPGGPSGPGLGGSRGFGRRHGGGVIFPTTGGWSSGGGGFGGFGGGGGSFGGGGATSGW